jgi:hypothetical protein
VTPVYKLSASSVTGRTNYGSMLAGNPAYAIPTDFESIATTTLGTNTASVTFSSIPATYTHLQIRFIARDTRAVILEGYKIQFNGDTAGNYSDHTLYGDGSSAGAFSNTSATFMSPYPIASANATASVFGISVVDILDYANTNKYKTIRSLSGVDNNGDGVVGFSSGNWRNTDAVTSITVGAQVGDWVEYSSFALYGIKGA